MSRIPTGAEIADALNRLMSESPDEAPSNPKKCTKKFACRCAKCKADYETMQKHIGQSAKPFSGPKGRQVNVEPKGKIYKGLPTPIAVPKQPKSSPGQIPLFD